MVMAHELLPKERPELVSLHKQLRALINSLRRFVDEEDYRHLEEAGRIHESIKSNKHYELLSGRIDLENNLKAMVATVAAAGGKLDDLTHGRLLDQAVYTIVRANIASTGLEFKLKRMRKG
jgi:hypothetical protein